jgi:hypothetical protein
MTDEQLEIENDKYVKSFVVLGLSNGRIAVLTPRRELFKVVDTWEEAKIVGINSLTRSESLISLEPKSPIRLKL